MIDGSAVSDLTFEYQKLLQSAYKARCEICYLKGQPEGHLTPWVTPRVEKWRFFIQVLKNTVSISPKFHRMPLAEKYH